MKKPILILILLCTASSLLQAQNRNLISSRNYFGIEAGLNYTMLSGASNFYFPYGYPYLDPGVVSAVDNMPLSTGGSGLGWLFGATLDLSFSDQIGLQGKLHYRAHSTSVTETNTYQCTDFQTGQTIPVDIEEHLAFDLSYIGLDVLLRYQFVPESWYGNIGFGFSSLLSDKGEGYRQIDTTTSNCEFLTKPSGSLTGATRVNIPRQTTNNYFNSSQMHLKLGVGTFIPIGSNGWVLTPELQMAVPLSELVASSFVDDYKANNATPPKMWYFQLTAALKFPFGPTTNVADEDSPRRTKVSDKKMTSLRGRVTNMRGEAVPDAQVTVVDLATNDVVAETKSDRSGIYEVELPTPGRYSITADANGYLFTTGYLEIDETGRITVGNGNLKMNDANGKVRLLVFFEFNKDALQRSSYPELDRTVHYLKANPNMKVEIAGHTDNVGADQYNLDLSQRRANSVKNYLVSKGIDASRLTAKGYGKTQPVASNDTEEGRAENRRVEFIVTSK